MKLIIQIILCIYTLGWTLFTQAAEVAYTNLYLFGEVTEVSCGVLIGEKDQYIELGTYNTKSLKAIGDKTEPVAIKFNLNGCPAAGSVTMTFTGVKDIENNELLALDTVVNKATNIAIEMSDKNKKRLPLGEKSEKMIGDANGNILATFYANYIVTKSSATAGIANSSATFTINYE